MGLIFAKFRKKKDTLQLLETLDCQIKAIEDFRRNTEAQQRWIVGRLLILLITIYVLSVSLSYYFFFPKTVAQTVIYVSLIIFSPLLILICKRTLMWYYNRKISKKQSILLKLREEKKKTLDIVMEKETYKVAKGILEKYAPEQIQKPNLFADFNTPQSSRYLSKTSALQQTALRQRIPITSSNASVVTPAPSSALTTYLRAPMTGRVSTDSTAMAPAIKNNSPNLHLLGATPTSVPFRRASAQASRDKSVLDKMVEFLMGDGPNSRYALICTHCSGHNGMALQEEFEYTAFRCCYCYTFNPSRKQRPQAPLLHLSANQQTPAIKQRQDSTSESEKNSMSSDVETDPDRNSRNNSTEDLRRNEEEHKDQELVIETLFSNKDAEFDKPSDTNTQPSQSDISESNS